MTETQILLFLIAAIALTIYVKGNGGTYNEGSRFKRLRPKRRPRHIQEARRAHYDPYYDEVDNDYHRKPRYRDHYDEPYDIHYINDRRDYRENRRAHRNYNDYDDYGEDRRYARPSRKYRDDEYDQYEEIRRLR